MTAAVAARALLALVFILGLSEWIVIGFSIGASSGRPGGLAPAVILRSGARSLTMMPVGIPRVQYKLPGSHGPEWLDIFTRMHRERIIMLTNEIDDDVANQVIGTLLYLDNERPGQPIYLYINSPGGSVISGLAIYDTMQHVRSEIVTINLGLAASMSSFLLCAGTQGRRLAFPHSRVMIHQPMGGAHGQAEDIRVEASQIMRIRSNIVKSYSIMTGQPVEQIEKDLNRDNFLSAEEALKYGLIDEIIPPNADKWLNLNSPRPSKSPLIRRPTV